MPRYSVEVELRLFGFVTVEAEDGDDAISKVEGEDWGPKFSSLSDVVEHLVHQNWPEITADFAEELDA